MKSRLDAIAEILLEALEERDKAIASRRSPKEQKDESGTRPRARRTKTKRRKG